MPVSSEPSPTNLTAVTEPSVFIVIVSPPSAVAISRSSPILTVPSDSTINLLLLAENPRKSGMILDSLAPVLTRTAAANSPELATSVPPVVTENLLVVPTLNVPVIGEEPLIGKEPISAFVRTTAPVFVLTEVTGKVNFV